jgi:hypothetical protein
LRVVFASIDNVNHPPTAKNYGLSEESRSTSEIFNGFAVDSNNRILGKAVA